MTEPFPHQYEISVQWYESANATISAPPRTNIFGGPPPQFGGDERVWSPEHLLLSSLGLCYVTTFLALAKRKEFQSSLISVQTRGTLNKTAEGLQFTRLDLKVRLGLNESGQQDIAQKLIRDAEKHCLIANALKTPVHLEYSIQ